MKEKSKIDQNLLRKYAGGLCSEEEKALVDSWYIFHRRQSAPLELEESKLATELTDVWANLEIHIQKDQFTKRLWKRWLSVAASITILVLSGYYFLNKQEDESYKERTELAETSTSPESHSVRNAKADLLPARSGAVLILSTGEKIYLDKGKRTANRVDHAVDIDLSDQDRIVYKEGSQANVMKEVLTNTLVVPKGCVYKIILADGTKVSLNADSKLTFPIRFGATKREVYLDGEAYFEVTKRSVAQAGKQNRQEFIVHAGESDVHVLGTKFNVKAYKADKKSSFTLEEGSISLSTSVAPAPLLLQPGQKAMQMGAELTIEEVDLQKELSWTSGDFYFGGITIREVMDEIARWYNVDIQYLGPVEDQQYISTISRKKSLKEVLEILETTTGIKFDIQQQGKERRLMVIP